MANADAVCSGCRYAATSTSDTSRTVEVCAARNPSVAIVSYQVVRIPDAYWSSGMATWSHTPMNAWPVASACCATATRSATVAKSSHGSQTLRLSIWTGSWMP